MDSLCEKVVFPEEDGPAIIMNFRSFAERCVEETDVRMALILTLLGIDTTKL